MNDPVFAVLMFGGTGASAILAGFVGLILLAMGKKPAAKIAFGFAGVSAIGAALCFSASFGQSGHPL